MSRTRTHSMQVKNPYWGNANAEPTNTDEEKELARRALTNPHLTRPDLTKSDVALILEALALTNPAYSDQP